MRLERIEQYKKLIEESMYIRAAAPQEQQEGDQPTAGFTTFKISVSPHTHSKNMGRTFLREI